MYSRPGCTGRARTKARGRVQAKKRQACPSARRQRLFGRCWQTGRPARRGGIRSSAISAKPAKAAVKPFVLAATSVRPSTIRSPTSSLSGSFTWRMPRWMRLLYALWLALCWQLLSGLTSGLSSPSSKDCSRLQQCEKGSLESDPSSLEELSDDEDDDEEDRELSMRLDDAEQNAEEHAASSQEMAAKLWSCQHSGDCVSSTSKIQFSRSSEIHFFPMGLGDHVGTVRHASGYQRSVQTKPFDGPSGHKCRRLHPKRKNSDVIQHCQDDTAEEWEDRCDDIANLMCQQRSMLLWSQSWA